MVIGFIMLAGLTIYLIISLILITIGVKAARNRGKPGWKGGLLVAVIMYLILFWDWIPTYLTHKYYCETQGGYFLNKTLEQWEKENPGVLDTLTPISQPPETESNRRQRFVLNQRFARDIYSSKHVFGISKRDHHIVDIKTGEMLAGYIDFNSGQSYYDPESFRDFKFWLRFDSCEPEGYKPESIKFNGFLGNVENIGSEE